MPHSHRSTSLKQSNKSHKSNKSSKRSINRLQGGKIQNRSSIKKKNGGANGSNKAKANRTHMAKQRREASKEMLLQKRRVQGRLNVRDSHSTIVPRVVGIISLSDREFELEKRSLDFMVDGADQTTGAVDISSSVTATYLKHKKEGHITFLTNSTAFRSLYAGKSSNEDDASVQAALDLSRVCDSIVFLLDGRDAEQKTSPISGMSIGETDSKTKMSSTIQQDYDHLISTRGDRVLSAIKAQGLPTPITLLVNFEGDEDEETKSMASCQSAKSVRRSVLKRKLELKKYLSRFTATEFGEGACKVMEIDIPAFDEDEEIANNEKNLLIVGRSKKILPDAFLNAGADTCPTRAAFIRAMCTMSASPPKWVSNMPRAYIISENNEDNGGFTYDKLSNELKLTGFIRGKVPFDVNSLVHLPNIGTFGVKEFRKAESPTSKRKRVHIIHSEIKNGEESQVLAKCDATLREPLEMFANPNALEGEQNLIGFGEDEHLCGDDEMNEKEDGNFARPAGWNDYQSAWLDAIKTEDDAFSHDGIDHGELAAELNKKKTDASIITGVDMDTEDDRCISMQERQALVDQRRRDQEDDLEFPDEVQVDENMNAGERFARYRSLKSFRKSYWDPKENLPQSYASIYHFGSFKATQGDVMADMRDVINAAESQFSSTARNTKDGIDGDEAMGEEYSSDEELLEGCVRSGTYVTLVIGGLSQDAYSRISSRSLLTAVSLLPHENKISVLHMGLSETSQCDDLHCGDMPVKSKDVLTFRCGWRSWQARPVFSQNNLNSDKHKFERFMPTNGSFFASSVFGPVTYTPCPVLAFRKNVAGETKFVALGSMIGADADRTVVKRIVLTGYPTRVHKRHATVKYMFYNPDDVKWFKPAELITKHGLQGNIIDSVGDHGTMKCLFNAPIKQHDTVCINLYKRIYPKFAPIEVTTESGDLEKKDILVL